MLKNRKNQFVALLLVAIAFLSGVLPVMATDPVPPDASGIVTTAQNTFYSVGAVVAAAVGFFLIVKIVKWIRK